MERPQEDAYRVAIEEYRAVSRARIAKLSDADLDTIVGVLPRRQISNYFVQFRKVLQSSILFLIGQFISISFLMAQFISFLLYSVCFFDLFAKHLCFF